ncbi:MAG: cofactor-independent phosphoglycerate mutase [Thermoguttaceae bacterium]
MKYAIIIPDGCADWPIESLGGLTPLQYAKTPNLDRLAESGIVGRSCNVPESCSPGSDVATLSLLGYDPLECFTGRAPLEAAALGIPLEPNDWAFRCNLVTIAKGIMQSFTAGHISTEEAHALLKTVQETVPQKFPFPIRFIGGVSYRNLTIISEPTSTTNSLFGSNTRTCPPHDWTDKEVQPALPTGQGSELLLQIMEETKKVLAEHPVNLNRIKLGKQPATQCWLWGQGKKPNIPIFSQQYCGIEGQPIRGAMITAVDLLRGIAGLLGWDQIQVPGITGYVDTDFAAKGQYAAKGLQEYDLVCVHIEATDEAGHEGSVEKKVHALEEIDAKVIPPIVEQLQREKTWRLLISPDHPTPVAHKTHTHGFVPWIIAGNPLPDSLPEQSCKPFTSQPSQRLRFDEETAEKSVIAFDPGCQLMKWFLGSPKTTSDC